MCSEILERRRLRAIDRRELRTVVDDFREIQLERVVQQYLGLPDVL
jgi:hypothetical protein